MATGTAAGLLDAAGPQSVYKHAILEAYIDRFTVMTTKPLQPRRAVLVDAFAGRGRHDDGAPASGERLMQCAKRQRRIVDTSVFVVEKAGKDFQALDRVAREYRADGLDVTSRRGTAADHLAEIEAKAAGASLFLFLDPCGAQLPWDAIVPFLSRRGAWPRTEALMNFSADLTRRAGGQLAKGKLEMGGVGALDTVCGGTWWREMALDAFRVSRTRDWESAADVVAHEYARRLGVEAGMRHAVMAVRRDIHHQPVYHLVFLTHGPTGLWVLNDAAATAREEWLRFLGPDADAATGILFPDFTVDDQIEREREDAILKIEQNLLRLLADGRPRAVVDHTPEIFEGVFGIAGQSSYVKAADTLARARRIVYLEKSSVHKHVLMRTPPLG